MSLLISVGFLVAAVLLHPTGARLGGPAQVARARRAPGYLPWWLGLAGAVGVGIAVGVELVEMPARRIVYAVGISMLLGMLGWLIHRRRRGHGR